MSENQHAFGPRLASAMDTHGPLCAGIDPHPALLADWGLPDSPDGLRRFALGCMEASFILYLNPDRF